MAFLAMLGGDGALVDSLVSAIPTVLAALTAHEGAPGVAQAGLAFLASMSVVEEAVDVLGRVAPRVLTLMQLHHAHVDVVRVHFCAAPEPRRVFLGHLACLVVSLPFFPYT